MRGIRIIYYTMFNGKNAADSALLHNVIMNELAIFSLFWPLILSHHVSNGFPFVPHYVSSISAGFQLVFPFSTRQAWPRHSPLLPLSHPSV
jgi:hypothetical protein